jgi:SlyX protein
MDPDQPGDAERLTQVEVLLSHLQHDVDKLNEVLIEQQAQIDVLKQLVRKVESVVDQIPEPPLDPEQERPPHY